MELPFGLDGRLIITNVSYRRKITWRRSSNIHSICEVKVFTLSVFGAVKKIRIMGGARRPGVIYAPKIS